MCVIGDILPLRFFFGERLRVREEECDVVHSISSNVPNLLCRATGSFAPLGSRSLFCLALFFGDELRLLDCGISAATGSAEVVATEPPEVEEDPGEVDVCFT